MMDAHDDEPQRIEIEEERIEIELPAVTAPTMPIEHTLTNSITFFQRTFDGGMQLKFVPLVATPNGNVPAPEAYVIPFSVEAWERFKRTVAADGEAPPAIETVRTFPGGLLNGGSKQ